MPRGLWAQTCDSPGLLHLPGPGASGGGGGGVCAHDPVGVICSYLTVTVQGRECSSCDFSSVSARHGFVSPATGI